MEQLTTDRILMYKYKSTDIHKIAFAWRRPCGDSDNLLLLHNMYFDGLNRIIAAGLPAQNNHHNARYIKCYDCGTYIDPAKGIEVQTDDGVVLICNGCRPKYNKCNVCGKRHTGLGKHTDGKYYCPKCFNTLFFRCSHCCNYYNNPEAIIKGDKKVCQSCASDYITCDICGAEYYRYAGENRDGVNMCGVCYNTAKYAIKSYHTHKNMEKVFYGAPANNLFIGQEIEVISKQDFQGLAALKVCKLQDGKFFFTESDCSVKSDTGQEGFEIITMPASYEYLRENKIPEMLAEQKELQSFKHNSCGHHIHISRKAVPIVDVAKLIMFFSEQPDFIEYIAQRPHNHYCKAEDNKEEEAATEKATNGNRDRYTAINITSRTIEFRIFKGNLSAQRIWKNIQFVLSMFEYANLHKYNEMSVSDYIFYVINNTNYPELREYLKKYDNINEQ